jgi:Fic family protein
MRRIWVFIHERADWPIFRWDHEAITAPLAGVRHRQGWLMGRMEGFGFRLLEEASLATLTQDVLKSSEIEGEILDGAQVRSSIARRLGLDIGPLTPADRRVEGVVEMMLDATRGFCEPMTDHRLFGWHAALFPAGWSGMRKLRVGDWRDDANGPMQVVSGPIGRERVHYEAPPAARLPEEMARFLAWFNAPDTLDPVLKAALAHLWFVTIHPFDDGNGRIARALADLLLARSERTPRRFYSLSAQIQAERTDYYEILERTQKGTLEVTPWLLWFLSCLDRAFDGAEITLATVLRKARFWEAHAGASLNDRQRKVINRWLDGFEGKLTSSKWAKLARCSQDTAQREIQDLIQRGILAKETAGGRSTSYSFLGSFDQSATGRPEESIDAETTRRGLPPR